MNIVSHTTLMANGMQFGMQVVNYYVTFFILVNGGESGIRTHEHLAMVLDFQSRAFDRSAISPARG